MLLIFLLFSLSSSLPLDSSEAATIPGHLEALTDVLHGTENVLYNYARTWHDLLSMSDFVEDSLSKKNALQDFTPKESAEVIFWLLRVDEVFQFIERFEALHRDFEAAANDYNIKLANFLYDTYYLRTDPSTGCAHEPRQCVGDSINDASNAVLRLATTYKESAENLAYLPLPNTSLTTRSSLSVNDAFQIGRVLHDRFSYQYAIQWLNLTLAIAEEQEAEKRQRASRDYHLQLTAPAIFYPVISQGLTDRYRETTRMVENRYTPLQLSSAFEQISRNPIGYEFSLEELYVLLSYCHAQISEFELAKHYAQKILEMRPDDENLKASIREYDDAIERLRNPPPPPPPTDLPQVPNNPYAIPQRENTTESNFQETKYNPEEHRMTFEELCRSLTERNPLNLDVVHVFGDEIQQKEYDNLTVKEKRELTPFSPLWEVISPFDQQCVMLDRRFLGWDSYRIGVEVASVVPPVLVFHNFLEQQECEKVRSLAKLAGNLERSYVHDAGTGEHKLVEYRSSQSSWLSSDYPEVDLIERRLSAVTQLDFETSDHFQILWYGPGGHYTPHTDFGESEAKVTHNDGGNRILTVLMYLNTVEGGGGTVFPNAYPPFAVRPKRGTAVIWYDLAGPHSGAPLRPLTEEELANATPEMGALWPPEGSRDMYSQIAYNREQRDLADWYRNPNEHGSNGLQESLHAACPVLKGVKWVANKWIREYPYNSHKYFYHHYEDFQKTLDSY